jgi:hypothetical protein
MTLAIVETLHVSFASRWEGLKECNNIRYQPEMAHRLKNRVIKLNWPRNEQCGVLRLRRHLGRGRGAEWSGLCCWGVYA